MEATMKQFMTILKAALRNERVVPAEEISPEAWEQMFRLAGMHKVLPLFYEAAYPALQQAALPCLPGIKRQTMQQILMQTMRTEEFLALNQTLLDGGVTPLVVKGIACRNLYPKPDHRQSSDEDVLIPVEQFAACHQKMLDFGMHATVAEDQLQAAYEVPYRKAGSPLYIELHKHLFPPESDAYGDWNRFFEGAPERAIPMTIQGHTVYTLGHTDHLFYLICHAFKHFLHSGFGIRQVCDIILYANAYGHKINWAQVQENCCAIRAEKFAAALFQIGSNHLVFDPDKAHYPDDWRRIQVNEMPMLEDLLSGGVYGGADLSRKHSSNITLEAVTAQKQGRKNKHAVLTSAFPPASRLEGRYPYLKRNPWLLPVAWCSRLWTYSKETRNSPDNKASDALKIGSERIALLKEYGVLE